MDTATIKNEPTPGREFAELTAQARAAYQEKRTKECIDITQRVLLADPGNAEANTLYEAIQSDIQRDLNDARALLEDSRTMTDGLKYRKAAEIILLKILYLDSGHEEARDLLAQAKGSPNYASQPSQTSRPVHFEETSFTASPQPVVIEPEPRAPINLKIPLIVAGAVVLSAGFWFVGAKAIGSIRTVVDGSRRRTMLAVNPQREAHAEDQPRVDSEGRELDRRGARDSGDRHPRPGNRPCGPRLNRDQGRAGDGEHPRGRGHGGRGGRRQACRAHRGRARRVRRRDARPVT